MKRKMSLLLLLILLSASMGIGFATNMEAVDLTNEIQKEVIIEINSLGQIDFDELEDFEYDPVANQYYLLIEQNMRDSAYWWRQIVVDYSGEIVADPRFNLHENRERMDIEILGEEAISLERLAKRDHEGNLTGNLEVKNYLVRTNTSGILEDEVEITCENEVEQLQVKGTRGIYSYQPYSSPHQVIMEGDLNPLAFPVNGQPFYEALQYDDELEHFDLSDNGEEFLYLTGEPGTELYSAVYLNQKPFDANDVEQQSLLMNEEEERFYIIDYYAADGFIVIMYIDFLELEIRLNRYDLEGALSGQTNLGLSAVKITKGQNGNTLCIMRERDPETFEFIENGACNILEVDWDAGKDNNQEDQSNASGRMRHLIREHGKAGEVLAEYKSHGFGLYKQIVPDSEAYDYVAPLRTKAEQVRLQIPYCDVVEKLRSGARNLLVEYKDQIITLPMEIFDCGDLLASMPCQDEATFEIILKADDADNVCYQIQLFVVEEVNGMTSVVHRKTIQ